jgi:chloramphenicol 3-O-phosphotransferase
MHLFIDEVLLNEEIIRTYLREFAGPDVLFVGVHRPLAVLEARERERPGHPSQRCRHAGGS